MSPLIRWNPFPTLLPDDLDKFFEGFGKSDLAGFTPAVNVYQTRDEVAVEAPLPGVDPDKVEVTVEHDVLTIQGHTEQKTEVDEKSYYRREVRSGSFYRSVPLPAAVEADKAEATYEQGILKVRIPKTPEAKPKTIAVKSPRP